jgi:putative transposase
MKEAYAVRRTVPPSAEIQASIDKLLAKGMVDDPQKMLSELARLRARLIIRRAVEDEFDTWLGRARYERRPERQRGLRNYDSGLRNGFRPRHVQTGEGELRIEVPQVREAAVPFVSKLFPKWHCKRLLGTDPLKALIVGAFVRGLSMRDVESLCEESGLGKTSRSTVARICSELHERFEAFCRRSLYDVNLVVLFLDAIYLPVRHRGPKGVVICAWGITETGARALVSVRLGIREAKEDWLELGRGLSRDLLSEFAGLPIGSTPAGRTCCIREKTGRRTRMLWQRPRPQNAGRLAAGDEPVARGRLGRTCLRAGSSIAAGGGGGCLCPTAAVSESDSSAAPATSCTRCSSPLPQGSRRR